MIKIPPVTFKAERVWGDSNVIQNIPFAMGLRDLRAILTVTKAYYL